MAIWQYIAIHSKHNTALTCIVSPLVQYNMNVSSNVSCDQYNASCDQYNTSCDKYNASCDQYNASCDQYNASCEQ